MNKKTTYTSLFICCCFYLHSAKALSIGKDSGVYISVNSGCVIPLGNFGSTANNNLAGFAMAGYGGNIEIEHPIKQGHLGLAASVGYYVNPFNINACKASMATDASDYQFVQFSSPESTPYIQIPVLFGLFYERTYKKITVALKAKLGVDVITSPHVNATENDPYMRVEVAQAPATGSAYHFMQPAQTLGFFAYSAELSVRYELLKHITLHGNIGYLNDLLSTANYNYNFYWGAHIPLSQLPMEAGIAYHIL